MPERTGEPPELWNSTVTFSHQRRSVGARSGAPTVRAAGPAGGVVPGAGCGGAGVGAGVGVVGVDGAAPGLCGRVGADEDAPEDAPDDRDGSADGGRDGCVALDGFGGTPDGGTEDPEGALVPVPDDPPPSSGTSTTSPDGGTGPEPPGRPTAPVATRPSPAPLPHAVSAPPKQSATATSPSRRVIAPVWLTYRQL
ncbi:hypothetical protein [Streptomyces sp. CB03238]|uniref:hypothetical protein n=1 Tax=Streptomyces sp. CB03238 TaxID=1907777 RepID=UPI001F4DC529|nr:hypothetical protein [Streptomyces sp. CB03238]